MSAKRKPTASQEALIRTLVEGGSRLVTPVKGGFWVPMAWSYAYEETDRLLASIREARKAGMDTPTWTIQTIRAMVAAGWMVMAESGLSARLTDAGRDVIRTPRPTIDELPRCSQCGYVTWYSPDRPGPCNCGGRS